VQRPHQRFFGASALAILLTSLAIGAPQPRYLIPCGGQRGQTVTVKVSGKFPTWPVRTWVNQLGIQTASALTQGTLSVQIAEDAADGIYWIRLFDATGSAAPLPFVVGHIPELLEAASNDTVAVAQPLPESAVTVNGQLEKRGDVDTYAVSAKRGQTLVADLDAYLPLNIPLDAVLQVLTPQGFVFAQNEDQLELDPRLCVTIPYDGTWHVRVFGFPATPNQSIEIVGNDNLLYRLTVTTGPYLDYARPMAASHTANAPIQLRGWNLPVDTSTSQPKVSPTDRSLVLEYGMAANSLHLPIVDYATVVEPEPNSPTEPAYVKLPSAITGTIERRGDVDVYTIDVPRATTLRAQIESRSLGFDLDPVLELKDTAGKPVAKVDDSGNSRDAELLQATAEGATYQVHVSDLHRGGGHRHCYLLSLTSAQPDFRLSIDPHELVIAPGATVELPVTIDRLQGFAEPVFISLEGLPSGVTASEAVSQPSDDSSKKLTIKLTASTDQTPSSGPVRILGHANDGQNKPAALSTPLNNRELFDLWLTVISPPSK
jgi:hypothetical protein